MSPDRVPVIPESAPLNVTDAITEIERIMRDARICNRRDELRGLLERVTADAADPIDT